MPTTILSCCLPLKITGIIEIFDRSQNLGNYKFVQYLVVIAQRASELKKTIARLQQQEIKNVYFD